MDDSKLIKYLLQETDEAENKEINAWIKSDPEHHKRYRHIQLIWEKSKGITPSKLIDVNKAWESFQVRKGSNRPFLGERQFLYPWYKIVATFSLLIIAVFLLYSNFMEPDNYLLSNIHINSNNKPLTDTLFDGSIITLNKNSQLDFNQSIISKKRKVNLIEGEAFFQVTRNEKRPFQVQADKAIITVLGTSFNIKKQNQQVEIILKSGSVQVAYENEIRILKPRDLLIINKANGTLRSSKVEDNLYNYYVGDYFEADETPLWRVVEIFNKTYDANIIILNERLRNLPLTTTFKNNSLETNLEVLKVTFGLNIIREPNRIIIK